MERMGQEEESRKLKMDRMQEKQRYEDAGKKNEKSNKNLEKKKIKIGFWNVADLDNKNAQFWEYIKEFDIIRMCWIEEKHWNKLKEIKRKDFNWKCQYAKREENKRKKRNYSDSQTCRNRF